MAIKSKLLIYFELFGTYLLTTTTYSGKQLKVYNIAEVH